MTVITYNDKDYISLTDMVRNMENGPALIEKWLRNKNTRITVKRTWLKLKSKIQK